VRVVYWEKWTGFEKEAMQSVVDDFNDARSDLRRPPVGVPHFIRRRCSRPPVATRRTSRAHERRRHRIRRQKCPFGAGRFCEGNERRRRALRSGVLGHVHHRSLWGRAYDAGERGPPLEQGSFQKALIRRRRPPSPRSTPIRASSPGECGDGQIEAWFLPWSRDTGRSVGVLFRRSLWDGATSSRSIRLKMSRLRVGAGYARNTASTPAHFSLFVRRSDAPECVLSGKVAIGTAGGLDIEFIDMYNPRMHWGAPFRRSKKRRSVAIANSDMLVILARQAPREPSSS